MRKPLAALAAAALAAAAFGTTPSARAQGPRQDIGVVKVDVVKLATGWRSSKIVGSKVYNEKNDTVGTIDDLIIQQTDQVLFAVLSVGGFLGVGDHLVAVPFSSLHVNADNHFVMPKVTKEGLKEMPEFKYNTSKS